MPKKVGLGRGLGALINDRPAADVEGGVVRIKVKEIRPNPWQPRRRFSPSALEELVQSVRERGVIQPVLVRPHAEGGYELIAGERRFRAARQAKLKDVPAVVMEVDDQDALEIALVENLQREDLNPVEEAEGYRQLADQFDLTQAKIAERVGKARASVANALRLLDLSDPVLDLLRDGLLSSGHGKVLLQVEEADEQTALASRVVAGRMSVRELERVVARPEKPKRRKRTERADIPPEHVRYLTEVLHRQFGTSVRVQPCRTLANGKKVKGTIELDYFSSEELDRLLHMLGVAEEL